MILARPVNAASLYKVEFVRDQQRSFLVLPVVDNPGPRLEVSFSPGDGGHVGKKFGGFVWEPRGQDSCHEREPLYPLRNVVDWRPCWLWSAVGGLWTIVFSNLRHVHELQV